METKVVEFTNKEMIKAITLNQVVCFPTETVYGMGVIYNSQIAFDNLVTTKERSPDKPFTLMIDNKDNIDRYGYINQQTKKIISTFMPGEITILVKPREEIYPWVKLNSKYIGIRVSAKEEVSTLIRSVGNPLLVTSANISNQPSCNDFEETYRVFNGKVPYIVKGETKSNIPSTIVVCDETLTLIREGSISFDKIKKVWEE